MRAMIISSEVVPIGVSVSTGMSVSVGVTSRVVSYHFVDACNVSLAIVRAVA